jgi:hypothetical protein
VSAGVQSARSRDHSRLPERLTLVTRPNSCRLVLSPLWLLVALLTTLALNASPAAASGGPETRVRAIPTTTPVAVGQHSSEIPGGVGCLRSSQPGLVSGSCVATKLSGSGPVPGVLEASPRVKGVGAINNWNGKPVEFVFDPGTGTFAMGKPAASAGMKGSPHQQLVAAIHADPRTVVGGIVQRADNGLLTFDEMSGHYWQNWNADVRQQFIDTLTGYGIGVG